MVVKLRQVNSSDAASRKWIKDPRREAMSMAFACKSTVVTGSELAMGAKQEL